MFVFEGCKSVIWILIGYAINVMCILSFELSTHEFVYGHIAGEKKRQQIGDDGEH